MYLIVDSGSTKTAWCVALPGGLSFTVGTAGINPVRDGEEAVQAVVSDASSLISDELIVGRASSFAAQRCFERIFFYGAGCIPPYSDVVSRALARAFPGAQVAVESDLLGAARALCGHDEGIACILGTGSNSCLYDGRRIVANTSPLGWILGDEGSGAVLGRTLVGDLLKGQLDGALKRAFFERFALTQGDVIEHVYRQPLANRWLASLVPFLAEHRSDEGIHALLVGSFRSFFHRNVAAYGRKDLPVGLVGGVAWQFQPELCEAAEAEGFMLGRVLKQPIELLREFHGE